MRTRPVALVLLLLSSLVARALAEDLPGGAIARFGSLSLRHDEHVYSVAFSHDGKSVASASADRTVRLWDAATGALVAKLEGSSGAIFALALAADGKTLATGCMDAAVEVWDVAARKRVARLEGLEGAAQSVALSPDGKLLASGSESTVRVWSVADARS